MDAVNEVQVDIESDGVEEAVTPGTNAARARPRVPRYSWAVLLLLSTTNVLSFMDRSILNILGQPIKEALTLADWQVGLLNGLAFAAVYTLLGLPLARLADTHNRVNIITICTVVWASMTAVCGLAQNFVQILLFRMGVGVGEAGSVPATQSLLTDYFPPELRASALSIFNVGIPLGALIGSIVGGVIVDHWGWRAAFMTLGWPGLLCAALVKFGVREAPRGVLDKTSSRSPGDVSARSLWSTARLLFGNATAFQVIAGLTSVILIGTISSTFLAPYLIRRFDLSYTDAGILLSATYLGGGMCGNLVGGLLADRAGRSDKRWYPWVPAIGIALSAPLLMAAFGASSELIFAIFMFASSVVGMTFMAPSYAILHNVVEPQMRAKMIAIVQVVSSLLGGGVGPLLGGLSIDYAAELLFRGHAMGTFATSCPGGSAPVGASAELVSACHATLASATQYTLVAWAPLLLWPAFHYFRASRTVRDHAKF